MVFHEKYQEIKDEEVNIIAKIEVELNVLRLELASEKTRSVDKKNYLELLNEIRLKMDSFSTSRGTQRLVGVIDSLIPVEEKPVEEKPIEEEVIAKELAEENAKESNEEMTLEPTPLENSEDTSEDNGSENQSPEEETSKTDEQITISPKVEKVE